MREDFTNFEKGLIKDLADHANNKIFPNEFIAKHMKAIAIELLVDDTFAIVTTEDVDAKKSNEYTVAEKSILDIMYLIDYLKIANLIVIHYYTKEVFNTNGKIIRIYNKQRYVYNSKPDDKKPNEILTADEFAAAILSGRYSSKDNESAQRKESFFVDNRLQSQGYIYNFIKSHIGAFIYVSPMLEELYKNNFKTSEQKRFDKQYKQTLIGIVVAIAVGILSIILGIWSGLRPTELAEIEDIKQEIKAVKTELPSVVDTRVTNDTLKVSVLKPTIVHKTK